jgi:DNA-directed RNA polymerase specialized sigma24 family protein
MGSPENIHADAAFCTTHWSVVLAARDNNSSQAETALAELCRTYWYPLYVYTRRRGNNPAEAEDLTQGFFARLLEKNYISNITPGVGRFRSFLLTSLKHYLANEWDRAQTFKRGGGKVIFSLDDENPEARYKFEPVDTITPETLFEQRWALSTDEPGCSYAEIAVRTGLKEGTVKVAVHRLRRRYGELLREEISNTVSEPSEVEAELRHLISVLSR